MSDAILTRSSDGLSLIDVGFAAPSSDIQLTSYLFASSSTPFKDAMQYPEWKAAMEREVASLKEHGVFRAIPVNGKPRMVKTKMIFSTKRDGTKKARLPATVCSKVNKM